MIEQSLILLQIIFIDIILAADNAIIIGLIAANFAPKNRKQIILWGVAGALVFKVIFAIFATYLFEFYFIKIFNSRRLKTKNTHGTGCTLSSAVATFLSCGKPVKKSCELGIKYVNLAIKSNPNYGKGHGPINHLNSIIINKKFR